MPNRLLNTLLFSSSGIPMSAELVTNGSFAADSNWFKGTGWTISAGAAHKAAGVGDAISQLGILVATRRYRVVFTVSNYVAGTLFALIGSGSIAVTVTANGTYDASAIADGADLQFFATNTFAGDLDNVSCKQYL